MSDRMSLDMSDLSVETFSPEPAVPEPMIQPVDSWPAVCTCIGICQPTADVYCSGGCPPALAQPIKQQPIAVAGSLD